MEQSARVQLRTRFGHDLFEDFCALRIRTVAEVPAHVVLVASAPHQQAGVVSHAADGVFDFRAAVGDERFGPVWMHPIAEHEIMPQQYPSPVALVVELLGWDIALAPDPHDVHPSVFDEVQQAVGPLLLPAVRNALQRRPARPAKEYHPPVDLEGEPLFAALGIGQYWADSPQAEWCDAAVANLALDRQVHLKLVHGGSSVRAGPPERRFVDGQFKLRSSSGDCPGGGSLSRRIDQRPVDGGFFARGFQEHFDLGFGQIFGQCRSNADIIKPCPIGRVEHDVAEDADLHRMRAGAHVRAKIAVAFPEGLVGGEPFLAGVSTVLQRRGEHQHQRRFVRLWLSR